MCRIGNGVGGRLGERLAQIATGSRPCLEEKKGSKCEVRSTFFERRSASAEARTFLGGRKLASLCCGDCRLHLIITTGALLNPSPAFPSVFHNSSRSLETIGILEEVTLGSSRWFRIFGRSPDRRGAGGIAGGMYTTKACSSSPTSCVTCGGRLIHIELTQCLSQSRVCRKSASSTPRYLPLQPLPTPTAMEYDREASTCSLILDEHTMESRWTSSRSEETTLLTQDDSRSSERWAAPAPSSSLASAPRMAPQRLASVSPLWES